MIYHQIEGNNIANLNWGTANAKTVTLSFYVRSSLTGTFAGSLGNNGYARSYPFTYTISSADTWEKKTITITGDTTGTWLTTNGVGISLRLAIAAGSSFEATENAWASGNYFSVSGATNVVGTASSTFYITGVQLEANTTATPFEHLQYGTQLALCQRYYQSAPDESIVVVSNVGYFSWLFPVVMRANPSVNIIGSTSGTQTIASTTRHGFFITNDGTTGIGYISSAEL